MSHAVLPYHIHGSRFVHVPCGFSTALGEEMQASLPVKATKQILLLLVVISQTYCLAWLILSERLCLTGPQYGSDLSLMLHGALIYSGTGGYKRTGITCFFIL